MRRMGRNVSTLRAVAPGLVMRESPPKARARCVGPHCGEGTLRDDGGRSTRAKKVGRDAAKTPADRMTVAKIKAPALAGRGAPGAECSRTRVVAIDRRLCVFIQLPHRRAQGSRWIHRLALRPLLRRAKYFRKPFRPGGWKLSARSLRHQRGYENEATNWRSPGWIVVRDALTIGPRDHEDRITLHTRPPADEDADHLLRAFGVVAELVWGKP
jgi:hypothetical protein